MSFDNLTPLVYIALSLVWFLILLLYVVKLNKLESVSRAIKVLLLILAIDAFRTLIESTYFGIYFSSLYGHLNASLYQVLSNPKLLIIPKLLNLAAALLVLFLLLRFWLPKLISEETASQQQLMASEKRAKSAIQNSPNPLVIHNEKGEILAISEKTFELTGYTHDELKTIEDWTRLLYRHKAEEILAKIRHNYTRDQKFNYGEQEIYTKAGEKLIWDIKMVPLGESKEGTKIHFAVAQDVTQTKKLFSSLEFTQYCLDQVSQDIFWIDADLRISSYNAFAAKQTGYSSDELQNKSIQEILLVQDAAWSEIWQQARDTKSHFLRGHLRTKADLEIPVEIFINYVEFAGKAYLCLFVQDILEKLEAERSIKESELRRRFALDSAKIGDWDLDLITNTTRRSLRHDQCFGYREAVDDWSYEKFLSHVYPEDKTLVDQAFQSALREGGDYDVEFRVVWPDKSVHWLWSKGTVFHDDLGQPTRVSGIQVDITDKKIIETEKNNLLEKLREQASLLDKAHDAIIVHKIDGSIKYWNKSAEELYGWTADEAFSGNIEKMMYANEQDFADSINICLKREEWRGEVEQLKRDGTTIVVDSHWTLVRNELSEPAEFFTINTDITRRKKAEQEIKTIAYYDALTGLPNRVLLENHLDKQINAIEGEDERFCLMILDLDNFKNVNDSYGHFMGDLLLTMLTERLVNVAQYENFVARFGADEFVVVTASEAMSDSLIIEQGRALAEKIMSKISQVYKLHDEEIFSSCSIGITVAGMDATVADTIKQADLAMHLAKKHGKNNIQFFDEELQRDVIRKASLETHLRRAQENDELTLFYQPQCLSNGQVVGCEALLRWHNPSLGTVSPGEFIPIAEEAALILSIGDWTLVKVCETLEKWSQLEGLNNISISLNISARQFKSEHFVEAVHSILSRYHFAHSLLKLELTESTLADDLPLTVKVMDELRKLGLNISLDDFGTGYSSLSYLQSLPIEELKIDQSFVRGVTESQSANAIADTIIKLADSLELDVVAEGVETESQLSVLKTLGCRCFQGYFFSKPKALDEIEKLIVKSIPD